MPATENSANIERNMNTKTTTVAVSGASGLVGSELTSRLRSSGMNVLKLVRNRQSADVDELVWDPASGIVNPDRLNGIDVVIHLAGENIAERRWSAAQKARIEHSRVDATRTLCEQLAQAENPPKTLICASAIGYYGDRGDRELDESAEPGEGFLPEVCTRWEAATQPAADAGIRVVNLRTGVVLSRDGGALAKMLLPFKLGLGGNVGSGEQYMSWITLEDLVGIIEHSVSDETLTGPVNCVAPRAVTNAEFTKTLGQVLHRPTIIPLPAFMARLILGEMADGLLLASARVVPRKLIEAGYEFRHVDLEEALHSVLDQ